MATHYKLLFRGAVLADQHPAVVRPRLQALLKGSDAQMDVMFSGKPVTIKKAVDEASAERWLDAFLKAGAKLELVESAAPVAEVPPPAQPTAEEPSDAETSGLQLAEVGADLTPAGARASSAQADANVSTDHLTLAVAGVTLGDADSTQANAAPPVDTSHLQLDKPGVRLGIPEAELTAAELPLELDFELGEVGEVLVESSPEVETQLPDLSHLQLESLPQPEPEELT